MNETNLIEDLRLLAPPQNGWVFGLIAALLGGSALAWVLWRRSRRPIQPAPSPRGDSAAWETALAALEGLASLLDPDRSRDYGIAATTILRRFLESRYQLHAPRLTTAEFLAAARASPALPATHQTALERFLEPCDLCKFGRYRATLEELQQLHAAAVAFVLESRPETGAPRGMTP